MASGLLGSVWASLALSASSALALVSKSAQFCQSEALASVGGWVLPAGNNVVIFAAWAWMLNASFLTAARSRLALSRSLMAFTDLSMLSMASMRSFTIPVAWSCWPRAGLPSAAQAADDWATTMIAETRSAFKRASIADSRSEKQIFDQRRDPE